MREEKIFRRKDLDHGFNGNADTHQAITMAGNAGKGSFSKIDYSSAAGKAARRGLPA